ASDTRYLYRVRAQSSHCTSDYSAELQVDGLPHAPFPLVFVASPTSITIRWVDTNTLETGYRVESRPAGSGAFSLVAGVAADVEQVIDTGLSPDSEYDYRVIAVGA